MSARPMRDSGIEWIGEIPAHWDLLPMGQIVVKKSIVTNQKKELLSVFLHQGVIRFSDVDKKRTNPTSLDLSKYQVVSPGDFVLNNQQAWRGSVGISKFEGLVSPAYFVLSLSDKLFAEYANYLFRNQVMVDRYLVCSRGVGSIQRNLYWPDFRTISVFTPPLPEQRAIATFLDRKTSQIDQIIEKKERLIKLLEEKRSALITQAVTRGLDPDVPMRDSGVEWIGEIPAHWEVKQSKFFCSKIVDGTHHTPNYTDEGIPFITVKNLTAGQGISFEDTKFISLDDHKDLIKRAKPDVGDLLISKDGTLGVTRVIETDVEFSIFVSVALLKLVKNIAHSRFIKYSFESTSLWHQFELTKTGSGLKHLIIRDLSNVRHTVPPLSEQRAIATFLDEKTSQIDQIIEKSKAQIEKLKEYRQALITSAVTGKIDLSEQSAPPTATTSEQLSLF